MRCGARRQAPGAPHVASARTSFGNELVTIVYRSTDTLARLRFGLLVLVGWLLLSVPPPAHAATNAARGGIGGVDNGTFLGGDGTGPALVTFNVTDLGLVKQVRDLRGDVLPDGANVAAGQDIWFVLYVDNPTPYPADDVELTDLLDESQFTYAPGS